MTTESSQLADVPAASRWARSRIRQFGKNGLALVGGAWLLILVVACFGASIFSPFDPLEQDLTSVLQLPNAVHILGTDVLGRDVLSRLLYGGQGAILGSIEVVLIALLIGVPLGVIAGYRGGGVDAAINRLADLMFSLPVIVVLLAVAAVFGSSTAVSMATLGIIISAFYIRLVRASTLAVRNELYVDAAKVSGISDVRIIFGHVLPNVTGPLIVQSSLTIGAALLVQGGLGFLGLGPPPPAPNWGRMTADATSSIYQQPWLMVPSGLVLVFTILAVNLIGDALRDGDGEKTRFSLLLRAPSTATTLPSRQNADPDDILSIEDLVVAFPQDDGDREVVRGITFSVARGETVGLVGESGSGKTMTALSVIGLLPYPGHVSGGRIVFDSADLVEADEKEFARIRGKRIAMISQEPMVALDPTFRVADQLVPVVRRHRRLGRSEAKGEARRLLEEVGIDRAESVLRSYPHQLSGGMAQRVAIAIALAGDPELLIADEPTTALDVTVQAGILDLLRTLQARSGMSIILVTHDLGVVADMCSRAVVMQEGRIVESASVMDLFARPAHPYTKELIANTPSLIGQGAAYV